MLWKVLLRTKDSMLCNCPRQSCIYRIYLLVINKDKTHIIFFYSGLDWKKKLRYSIDLKQLTSVISQNASNDQEINKRKYKELEQKTQTFLEAKVLIAVTNIHI